MAYPNFEHIQTEEDFSAFWNAENLSAGDRESLLKNSLFLKKVRDFGNTVRSGVATSTKENQDFVHLPPRDPNAIEMDG